MINLNGYDDVSTGGNSLPANGYIAKIIAARTGVSRYGVDSLFVDVDISEGQYTGYFKKLSLKWSKDTWTDSGTITIPLYENNLPHWRLKNFLEILKHDNPDLKVISNTNFDERNIIGKSCGIIVGLIESKKTKRDGSHWANPYVLYAVSVDDIRSGNFTVPPIKRFSETSKPDDKSDPFPGSVPVPNDDLPF